ncbi:MAG: RNA polymerase sigma factor [Bacteroidota bacterium]
MLIKRILNRDKRALYQLYDKYSGALFGVIVRMCRNEALAEDLLQETFVRIWKNMDSYDGTKGRFYTWAYRIAKNITLNALRKKDPLIQTEDLSVYSTVSQTETYTDYTELNGALRKLQPHHQEALSLVYFKGYTHREAHEEMGVPLGTFKSYVRQALKELRQTYGHGHILLCLWAELISYG